MSDPIRIGVVDDHPLFREGVIHSLQPSARFTIAAAGKTLDEALRMVGRSALDILLLDIAIRTNGMETIRAIRRKTPDTRIVILTASDDESLVIDALRAGAQGYILKEVSGFDLMRALEFIHRGEPYVAPALAARLLSRLLTQTGGGKPSTCSEQTAPAKHTALSNSNLTPREKQVLGYLAQGLANREIAAKLGISTKTIGQHTMHLFSKIGVRNRVEAMLAALETGH